MFVDSVTSLASLVLAPFILVTIAFAVEVFVGLLPLERQQYTAKKKPNAVIVIPAHNEEAIIAESLCGLLNVAGANSRIVVVADNCDDRTADVARGLGVEVAERISPELRGKGHALAFAREYLRSDPPDVVLIIDADCRSDSESIAVLIDSCAATSQPCQATNLQAPVLVRSPAEQLSTFAFYIKNVIRQRAVQRIAGRAHLLGTGMAFPWRIFERATLASSNIAEDLQLGIELAEGGTPTLFIEEAAVWSDPETRGKMLAQRERWEGGFLQNAVSSAPLILGRSLRCADPRGLWAAMNLLIPPLALLTLLDTAALVVGGLAWMMGASAWPTAILAFSLMLSGLAILSAWVTGGSRFVTIGSLARIPAYVIWKIPMYLRFVRHGTPQNWIRTR